MKLVRTFLAFVLLGAAFYSCKPDPIYPAEPMLEFKEYFQAQNSDSLQVIFTFTDGDGDIGVSPLDTNYNMLLTVYRKNASGQWIVLDDPGTPSLTDSLMYKYRVPRLTAGQIGLEGDIYLTINKSILRQIEDTLQFNAVLIDQSHNYSSWVRTPEVVLIP